MREPKATRLEKPFKLTTWELFRAENATPVNLRQKHQITAPAKEGVHQIQRTQVNADTLNNMVAELYRLTATEVAAKIKSGEVTVEDYAKSLLKRIEARDEVVQAWAYLDAEYVIKQAKALDAIPKGDRGPLHGIAIAVKDVIYTKGEFEPGSLPRSDRLII